MKSESNFFEFINQLPKAVRIIFYSCISIIIISLTIPIIKNAITTSGLSLIWNEKPQKSFEELNYETNLKNFKLDSIKNNELIRLQKEQLAIDTLKTKYKIYEKPYSTKIENGGNIIDGGPISNVIYYAIAFAIIYLFQIFGKSKDYFHLILNYCLGLLLVGLFALIKGILIPTVIKGGKNGFNIDIETSSVGLITIIISSILIYFTIYYSERKKNDEK